jgi:hypothetical protein
MMKNAEIKKPVHKARGHLDDYAEEPTVRKHAGGRPTDYRSEYCADLEEDMAKGYSATAWAGKIGVSRQTVDNWAKAHPEFLEALSRAKARRLRHWEAAGLRIAADGGSGGTATIVTFGLRNMGGDEWQAAEKTERTISGGLTLSRIERVVVDRKADA